jgi:hypothetical protein
LLRRLYYDHTVGVANVARSCRSAGNHCCGGGGGCRMVWAVVMVDVRSSRR